MSATAESVEISRDPQFQALLERWQARTERELDTGLATETQTVKAAGDMAPIVVEIIRSEGGFVLQVGGRQLESREELTDVLRKIKTKLDGAVVRAADDAPLLMAAAAIQKSVTCLPVRPSPT